MKRIEGKIKAIRQCGGCVELTVEGTHCGTFIMDNCCAANIIANEGPALIGRYVECCNGQVRFHPRGSSPLYRVAGRTRPRQEMLRRAIVAPLRHLRNWTSVKIFANGKVRIKFKNHTVKTISASNMPR